MPDNSLPHQFLFKEYDSASKLTFHADELRDKLSTFFLTFAGAAVAAVGLLLQDSFKVELFGDKRLTAGLFLIGVSVIGVLILFIHARLRSVQLEHFELINRIRAYCLQRDLELWNTVKLCRHTLPEIKFSKLRGSELWALTILLPTAVLFGTGCDCLFRFYNLGEGWHFLAAALSVLLALGFWECYVQMAKAPIHSEITSTDVDAWMCELKTYEASREQLTATEIPGARS